MTSVPRFDEELVRVLETQAAVAGETVDDYISRAVAERLVADVAQHDEPGLESLLQHLITVGVTPSHDSSAEDAIKAVLSDPARLRALRRTGLMDSPREAAYDRIVTMASDALAVPAAAITLLDDRRQFFKSVTGVPAELAEARETPIERSICQYTVASGQPLVVEDARNHPLLKAHPVVKDGFLVAYAGIPFADDDGHFIGTLCVWDNKPRNWTFGHVQTLTDLAELLQERIFAASATAGIKVTPSQLE